MAGKIKVPSELVPSQSNKIMLRSKYVYDDVKGHTQEEINAALEEQIESKVIEAGGVNWDTVPTAGSNNAVKSKDIKAALEKVTGYFVLDSNVLESTVAKTVTVADFPALAIGGSIKVKMLTKNTATNPTLKIGSANATAYPLYYNNERASSDNSWEENEVISVYFDGTNYQASNAKGGGGIGKKKITPEASSYIATNGTTIGATTRNQPAWQSIKYAVAPGDVIGVSGTGASTPRLWAIADSGGNILAASEASVTENNIALVMPENAAWVVLNSSVASNPQWWYGKKGTAGAHEILQEGYLAYDIPQIKTGTLYKEGDIVRTEDSQVRIFTEDIEKLTTAKPIPKNDIKVYITASGKNTYRAINPIEEYNNIIVHEDGDFVWGSPSTATITVDALGAIAGTLNIAFGENTTTVDVAAGDSASVIAGNILAKLEELNIEGWEFTQSDASITALKSEVGVTTLGDDYLNISNASVVTGVKGTCTVTEGTAEQKASVVLAVTVNLGSVEITLGEATSTIELLDGESNVDIAGKIAEIADTGWTLTDNEDGTISAVCNSGGANVLNLTIDDTADNTGLSVSTTNTSTGLAVIVKYASGSWSAATLAEVVTYIGGADAIISKNELALYATRQYSMQDFDDRFVWTKGQKHYTEGGYFNQSGTLKSDNNYGYTDFIPVSPGSTLTWHPGIVNSTAYLIVYDANKHSRTGGYWTPNTAPRTFTLQPTDYFVRFSFPLDYVDRTYLNGAGQALWRPFTNEVRASKVPMLYDGLGDNTNGTIDQKTLSTILKDMNNVFNYEAAACGVNSTAVGYISITKEDNGFTIRSLQNGDTRYAYIAITGLSAGKTYTISIDCESTGIVAGNRNVGIRTTSTWSGGSTLASFYIVDSGTIKRTFTATQSTVYIVVANWDIRPVGSCTKFSNIEVYTGEVLNVSDIAASKESAEYVNTFNKNLFVLDDQTVGCTDATILKSEKIENGFKFTGTNTVDYKYAYASVGPLITGREYTVIFDYDSNNPFINRSTAGGISFCYGSPLSSSPSTYKWFQVRKAKGTYRYTFTARSRYLYFRIAANDIGNGTFYFTNIRLYTVASVGDMLNIIEQDDIDSAAFIGSYTGNQIPRVNPAVHRIGWTRICGNGSLAKSADLQGCAAYEGYLFQFANHNAKVYVYNLSSSTPGFIAEVTPTQSYTTHCNNVNFGKLKYDSNDFFPLLYVSGCDENPRNRVQVYRITLSDNNEFTIAQVQDIRMPVEFTGWGQLYLDNVYGTMWYGAAAFYKFNVPAIKDSEDNVISYVQLTSDDILDNFTITAPGPNQQGGFIHTNGYGYIAYGVPQWNNICYLQVVDFWGKKVVCPGINLMRAGWGVSSNDTVSSREYELEAFTYHDGHLIANTLSNTDDSRGGIYRFYI